MENNTQLNDDNDMYGSEDAMLQAAQEAMGAAGPSTADSVEALLEQVRQLERARTQYVVNVTDQPHSLQFRIAGPGTEVKIYGKDIPHILAQVKELADSQDLAMSLQEIKRKYAELMK